MTWVSMILSVVQLGWEIYKKLETPDNTIRFIEKMKDALNRNDKNTDEIEKLLNRLLDIK